MDLVRVFVYTSRKTAQDIVSTRSLRAGPSRVLYVSAASFATGAEAAAALSIKDQPVELRCAIELDKRDLKGPTRAHPLYGTDGSILRPGYGPEYRCNFSSLPLEGKLEWESLGIP